MKLLLFVLFISCAFAQPNFWPFNYGQHNDHDEHNDSKCPALKEANNNDFENVCLYYDVMQLTLLCLNIILLYMLCLNI